LQLLHEVEGGERFADAGAVIVTELVANAVQHGPRGDKKILVRFWVDDQRLRIEVHDASSVRPTVREVATLDERGRGMHLVMALSQQWGCCPRTPGIGKIVWAIVPPARGGC
jgi:anti-sigma regulatory factor (Ser/Thr protein kinase)